MTEKEGLTTVTTVSTVPSEAPEMPETSATRANAGKTGKEDAERARLTEENKMLSEEIARLREESRARDERDRGLDNLKKLLGGREDELYDAAVRRADESEDLRSLPAEKRFAMSYYLILGERAQQRAARGETRQGAPLFMHSDGSGVSPATDMQPPKTFATARENAKKYFGGV